jgi:hypothetical protein
MLSAIANWVLPNWVRLAAGVAAACVVFLLGQLHGERIGGQKLIDHVQAEASQTVKIAARQVTVVIKTEKVYRDRIQKIYVQGGQIENSIPEILTPDVDRRLPLPAGFVRILDAAWSGEPVGPSDDSDGRPSPVPPSVVAANEAANATSCRVWREQALGWRSFYADQQVAINGKAGDWAKR